MTRRDLYGECSMEEAPIDVFTAECCMRCINPECTRSSFGKSKFEIRTNTWYDRLFGNVPRMHPDDPRYKPLSAQKFLTVEPELAVNSNWEDPVPVPEAPPQTPVEIPFPVLPEPVPPPHPPEQKGQLSKDLVLTNTPLQQGQMITPPQKPVQPSASWDLPVPPVANGEARMVKPGTKIKLG